MPSLNRVQLIGRLGKEPGTRYTPTGKKVTSFSVAVDRRWKNPEGELMRDTDWFNIETWGTLGETSQRYLQKGQLVYVEGRLRTDRYEENGQTRYFTRVVASNIQFLEWPKEKEEPAHLPPEMEEDETPLLPEDTEGYEA